MLGARHALRHRRGHFPQLSVWIPRQHRGQLSQPFRESGDQTQLFERCSGLSCLEGLTFLHHKHTGNLVPDDISIHKSWVSSYPLQSLGLDCWIWNDCDVPNCPSQPHGLEIFQSPSVKTNLAHFDVSCVVSAKCNDRNRLDTRCGWHFPQQFPGSFKAGQGNANFLPI